MSEPSALWTFFPLLPLKLRNTALDAFFYDVGSLSPAEVLRLLWIDAQKGSVVVVSPANSDKPERIRYYQKALRFIVKEKKTFGPLPWLASVVLWSAPPHWLAMLRTHSARMSPQ